MMRPATKRRWEGRWKPLLVLAMLAAALLCGTLNSDASSIIAATLNREGLVTELSFTLDSPAPKLHLSAHGNELWIDLDRTGLQIPARPLYGRELAPLGIVRAFSPGGLHARIVVEVTGRSDYAIVQRQREIVLRLAPAGQAANLRAPLVTEHQKTGPYPTVASPTLQPLSPSNREPSNRAQIARAQPVVIRAPSAEVSSSVALLPGNPLVMIDPGHGGYDPGTQSASGILEKDVALSLSRRLVYTLKTRGVRAQLTRDSDDFISLPERTRRANLADPDLFVSIHLNSSPNPETTGIEVYYLNNTTDRATIRLARMENARVTGTSAPEDGNLNYILADLRQNYKATEAASLARMIDKQTVADLDAQLGLEVNPLGAKMGPFYVLVGAHMPAVLVECGFLSNAYEAQRLTSAQYQETLAQGIATAVVHYLSSDAAGGNL
jgi:N-acetylmuramoyl-L-alanine amidase